MTRPLSARACLFALVWVAVGCARAPAPEPVADQAPGVERVVLVSIDTLRADHLGCYGSRSAQTPTLDGLAARGVRFETAIAPTPITLPSHTSLLTGLDPPRHGVHHNTSFALAAEIPTLAERFAGAGHATAAFLGSVVLDRRYGLARGFETYDDRMSYRRTVAGWGGHGERRAGRVVDSALAWLEQAPERFFLWIHLYDPHANYEPPPAYRPRAIRTAAPGASFEEQVKALSPQLYAGEIAYTDAELGRFLDGLEARFGRSGTLLVVTSDHGESLGEHGELAHSLGVYDATQHVPLLMAGPDLPAGRVVTAPVRLVDVAPTLLARAGLPPLPDADGEDLGPWIRGERADPLPAYVETLATWLDFTWSPILGLRSDGYKYLRTTRPELYDLVSDPGELRNLAEDDPERVTRFDMELAARLEGARPVERIAPPLGEERAQLEALGYVVPGQERAMPELGWVGGPDPKDRVQVVILMLEARSLLAVGEAEQAYALLDGVPEAGGWIADARAQAALDQGRAEEALVYAREAVAADPDRPGALVTLGGVLAALGRDDEAIGAYRRASELDPTDPDPLTALGRLAEKRGDASAAAGYYERANSGPSPGADAALYLAALHFDGGRPSRARALLREAWPSAAASGEARIRAARAEARAGYPDLALKRLDQAYRRNPSDQALSQAFAEIRESYGSRHFPRP